MAEVFKAKMVGSEGFERLVVVKRILPSYADNESFVQMLIQEAKIASSLQHVNIVQTYDLGEINGRYYISLEYVHGSDLLRVLAQTSRKKAYVPFDMAAYLISEAGRGLDYAHRARDLNDEHLGIVHRDITPANIMLSYTGEVKIGDFGVSRAAKSYDNTSPGNSAKGKLAYMSPEQVGGRPFDHRADIFSLGILLYETLTLKRLFLAKTDIQTLMNVRESDIDTRLKKHAYIPDDLADILRKSITVNPSERYETARDMRQALKEYLTRIQSPMGPELLGRFVRTAHGAEDLVLPESPMTTHEMLGDEPSYVEPHRFDTITIPIIKISDDESSETGEPVAVPLVECTLTELERTELYLRRKNEAVLGPLRYGHVCRMIKHGAVAHSDELSRDKHDWVTVPDVPLLRPFFNRNAGIKAQTPTLEGPASLLSLPYAVYQIAGKRMSGILSIQYEAWLKEVFFQAGKVVTVHTNDPTELFGAFLVERKIIRAEQASIALSYLKKEENRLGDILVANGLLESEELGYLVKEHQRVRFRTIIALEGGWFSFHASTDFEAQASTASIPASSAVTRALRYKVEASFLERLFRDYWSETFEVIANPLLSIHQLGLSESETMVVNTLMNHDTLEKARTNQALSATSTFQLLWPAYILVQAGFIRFPHRSLVGADQTSDS